MASLCKTADYLEVSEMARSAPGFNGPTDLFAFVAHLVWCIPAELDPHSLIRDDQQDADQIECRFLVSSSTLNCTLPNEREARYTNLKGVIEELHLPGGGIVTLDVETTIAGRVLSEGEHHVYFHRSRLYINGCKVSSSVDLGTVLVPGDRVTVDVVANNNAMFVSCATFWMALAVKAKTTDRGVTIANALRMEVVELLIDDRRQCGAQIPIEVVKIWLIFYVTKELEIRTKKFHNKSDFWKNDFVSSTHLSDFCICVFVFQGSDPNLSNVCLGRIVYLRRPEVGAPVTEGIAVIDSGGKIPD